MPNVVNLGLIAQQTELIFPNSVKIKENEELDISDFRYLDKDEIYMSMLGAIQKLQQRVEFLENN